MRIQCCHILKLLRFNQGGHKFQSFSTSSCSCHSSAELLSSQSRDKCISRIKKMKSLRPAGSEEVRQIAAVLGTWGFEDGCTWTWHVSLTSHSYLLSVPLVDISGEVHLLYTRRSLGMSSHSGQVSFPGGKQDKDDVDLTRTALRKWCQKSDFYKENCLKNYKVKWCFAFWLL